MPLLSGKEEFAPQSLYVLSWSGFSEPHWLSESGGSEARIVCSISHVSRKLGPLSPYCVLKSPSGEGCCQDGSQVLFPSAPAAQLCPQAMAEFSMSSCSTW